jgi:hypothetical protein
VFAPHSIAAAEISLGIVGIGWLIRALSTRRFGFHRTPFDLPICLFYLWTVASSFFSEEPRISIAKIQSASVIFLFYLIQAVVTRRTAVMLVAVMILSGVAGSIYSVYDLARGRGIIVEAVAVDSPLQQLQIREGDVLWRIGRRRIRSVTDIDEAIRDSKTETELTVSVISQGEQVDRPGFRVTDDIKQRPSPSGIIGSRPTHRFRASGWTSHYETFAEILLILAQLAFGLGLANFRNHRLNRWAGLAFAAATLLALGIAFTAMRTALVAMAIGICVISLRALRGRARMVSVFVVALVMVFGAFFVYQTRAAQALWLQDPSSTLRGQVATIGLKRVMLHPLFGHGMDSMHLHWTEWGFPGRDLLHMHSTPLQFAFDRGLPAVIFWLWIMIVFWLTASRAERSQRKSRDTNRYGILLGATGVVAAVFADSIVNYAFGNEQVMIVFWWLMGMVVVMADEARQHQGGVEASNHENDPQSYTKLH